MAHLTAGDGDRAIRLAISAVELSRNLPDVGDLAVRLGVLGWIAAENGDPTRSAILLGAEETLGRGRARLWLEFGGLAVRHEVAREAAHRQLGATAFTLATEQGAAMCLEKALAFATGETPVALTPRQQGAGVLTARETEIVTMVASGMSNKEIARELVLSPRTVENHVQRALTKLGFTSRTQIAVWAVREDA